MENIETYKKLTWILPIIVIALAIFPMPYVYYSFLRIVICGCSIFFAIRLFENKQISFVWIFGFLALLYNPIVPVYLYEKEIWTLINIATGILFYFKRNIETDKNQIEYKLTPQEESLIQSLDQTQRP